MNALLRDLLDQCKRGESEAIAELVRRFQPWALDLAAGILDDKDLAEDAVQESFIKAVGCLNDLREPDAFPGWIRQILRTCCNRISRSRREALIDCEIEASGEPDMPGESVQRDELCGKVREALAALPSNERETTELFYFDDLSCREISDFLHVPEGTVKRRLHDARKRLRGMLLGYIGSDVLADEKKHRDRRIPL